MNTLENLFGTRIARGEQGVSLFMVMIALVVMSLAAISLIRSVDTGSLIIGNLGFKRSATASADAATEVAIAWLNSNNGGTTLHTNISNLGYYASVAENLDFTGNNTGFNPRRTVNWPGAACSGTYTECLTPRNLAATGDYSSSYLIERECRTAGDPNVSGNSCAKPVSTSTGSNKRGEIKYGEDKRFSSTAGPFYRIIVRTAGPRNTVSFTETYVHF